MPQSMLPASTTNAGSSSAGAADTLPGGPYEPIANPPEPQGKPAALSPLQQAAIYLLVRGHRTTKIARILGIHRCTLTQWRLHNALFREHFAEAREIAFDHFSDGLRSLLPSALSIFKRTIRPAHGRSFDTAKALIRCAHWFTPPPPQHDPEILKRLDDILGQLRSSEEAEPEDEVEVEEDGNPRMQRVVHRINSALDHLGVADEGDLENDDDGDDEGSD